MKQIIKIDNYFHEKLWFLKDTKLIEILDKMENWRFVGGVVRDALFNRKSYDIDISTTMTPEEIMEIYPNINHTIGKRFGTIMLFTKNYQIEITTTRRDIRPTGRHTEVEFTKSFYEDSCRRDFTINSLYCDKDNIYDYHNAMEHIKAKQVIFIGNPKKRIEEDYLRIMRYVRFFTRFSPNNQDIYQNIISSNISGLEKVSWERILDELYKILENENYPVAIKMLDNYNIFPHVYGFKLNIINMDQFIHSEKIAILLKNCTMKLPKNIRKLINIINNPINLEYLAILWNNNKTCYFSKFLIRYNICLNNKAFEHLLDLDWNVDFDTSHWQNLERGMANYAVKLLFLQNKKIEHNSIEQIIAQYKSNPPFKKKSK